MVLFGREDGKILVMDYRSDDTAKFPAGILKSNHRQSVYRMEPLFHNRPGQLLVRNSNSWGMHDLRKMTGTGNKKNAAVIHDIPLMNGMTRTCKGMATDPLSTTILVPVQKDDDKGPAIKLWSLQTGDYIGCKPVLQTSDPNSIDSHYIPVSEIELCSTVATAWSFPTHRNRAATNAAEGRSTSTFPSHRSDEDEGDYIRGRFGLWLKLGNRGIYHITCTGRSYDTME